MTHSCAHCIHKVHNASSFWKVKDQYLWHLGASKHTCVCLSSDVSVQQPKHPRIQHCMPAFALQPTYQATGMMQSAAYGEVKGQGRAAYCEAGLLQKF